MKNINQFCITFVFKRIKELLIYLCFFYQVKQVLFCFVYLVFICFSVEATQKIAPFIKSFCIGRFLILVINSYQSADSFNKE